MAPTNPPAAVVYLEGNFSAQRDVAPRAAGRMAQKNMAFAPDLVPVLVGSVVDFPNMDDTYHTFFLTRRPNDSIWVATEKARNRSR